VNLSTLSAFWSRRKYLALGLLAATLAAALTVALAMPGIYRSTATVLVARPEMTAPSARAALTGELEARLNRIGEEILSRSRLEQLLDRYDLYGPHTKDDMEQSVTRFRRDVRVDLSLNRAPRCARLGLDATGCPAKTRRGTSREQVSSRLTGDDAIGHCIGAALVAVSGPADPALERHAVRLLHHVRSLVGGRVERRRLAERNMIANGIRFSADRVRCLCSGAADVGAHVREVATEQSFEAVAVRKRPFSTAHPLRRMTLNVPIVETRCGVLPELHGRQSLCQRALPGRRARIAGVAGSRVAIPVPSVPHRASIAHSVGARPRLLGLWDGALARPLRGHRGAARLRVDRQVQRVGGR